MKADTVFHLAAVVEPDRFTPEPYDAFDVNITGTLSVLNYCRQFQARCIFASTSAVYEPLNTWGLLSEDSPVKPTSPYAVSKLIAENICFQQSEQYDIPCAVMRIFNVYGPGQRSTFLIPYVLECLLEKRILSLRMPEAQRDFVYIDDVVDALVKASTVQKSGARMYNIGTGNSTQVIDMVRKAESLFKPSVGIDIAIPNPGEPMNIVANVNRATHELGWLPIYNLKEGLEAIKAATIVSQGARPE